MQGELLDEPSKQNIDSNEDDSTDHNNDIILFETPLKYITNCL
tara:strand:- start:113 stop:241 length:129 start_codon:yes stop_codon:yes gene_type:complete